MFSLSSFWRLATMLRSFIACIVVLPPAVACISSEPEVFGEIERLDRRFDELIAPDAKL